MKHAPKPLLNAIALWSEPAQAALWTCRTLFHEIAEENDLGPLDETLKWGQPSWRPTRPRTGSTLRMGWSAAHPDRLSFFVDCKTDLASRMRDMYPDLPQNDGRRQLGIDLGKDLPLQAVSHMAQMTLAYHLRKRAAASMG
ncbi:MAG: hypothetical protein AB8B60_02450 [Sulfitobacter sp.]